MSKSNIKVASYDRTGRITFQVDNRRYTYIMDAMYFYNGFFKSWIKYAPGKAFNFARKVGEREASIVKSKPKQKPNSDGKIQGHLF